MSRLLDHLYDFWRVVQGKASMFVHHEPPRYDPGDGLKPALVIIPGISSSWVYLKPLIDFAKFHGYPVCPVPSLGMNLLSIPHSAALVKKTLDDYQISRAIIVGHSKGGLIGKYALDHINQDGKIIGLVALAAPFHGAGMAKYGPHPAYKELLPDSETIRELERVRENNHRIISIYPAWDNKIEPELGSVLPGALRNTQTLHRGHDVIIFDKDGWEAILTAVRELNNKPV